MQAAAEATARAAALWQTFTAKAEAVGAVVERAAGEAAAAGMVSRAAVATRGLADRFPRVAAACRPAEGGAQPPASEVAGAALFAVAETGSVVLGEADAGRAACFLAERLWLLVPGDALVATLDDALERVAALVRRGTPYVTLMSGPSRTADIERTLTIGVHGPRELVIVVVGREGA